MFAGVEIKTSSDSGTFTIGSSANISCNSYTPTMKMEWLRDKNVVVAFMSTAQQLDLYFNTINDSIHDKVYICRVTRDENITVEQNITISVSGE